MNHFTKLPPELWFQIVTLLPIPSLVALKGVSKEWRNRLVSHESFLYRHAAVVHGFIPSFDMSFDEAKASHDGDYIKGATSWASFCEIQYRLQRSWIAKGSVYTRMFSYSKYDVHRFKIDEERGFAITTHKNGGLTVRDLKTDEVLWGLPSGYVRDYAHCEYGNGFLIFDRAGRQKEVWRLASEGGESPTPPDEDQQNIYLAGDWPAETSKGHFRPWAVLTVPVDGAAFRFVYPTLLVCGQDSAYLYDVVTCRPLKTITGIQAVAGTEGPYRISYVELSPTYAFICVGDCIGLFDRESGELAYSVSCQRALSSVPTVKFSPESLVEDRYRAVIVQPVFPSSSVQYQRTTRDPFFCAVHVSPDGMDMVAMDSHGRLIFFKDIPSLVKDPHHDHLAKHILVVEPLDLPKPGEDLGTYENQGIYLAYEHGRVGFISLSGIYIFTLDTTKNQILAPGVVGSARQGVGPTASDTVAASPFPNIYCLRIGLPQEESNWYQVSCLQMSETRMFFTWHPDSFPRFKPPKRRKRTDDGSDDEADVEVGDDCEVDVDEEYDSYDEYEVVDWDEGPPLGAKVIACFGFDKEPK